MDVESAQVFTSVLALLALGGAVATVLVRLAGRRSASAAHLADAIGGAGLWLAFIVAAGAMVGSLYFSESAGYTPCKLCWYQRIAMYPLVPITLVAALRNDRRAGWYVVPTAVVGLAISSYHYLIEWRPSLEGGACGTTGPGCADIWFREFGFVTLAFMAMAGFIAIIIFTLLAASSVVPSPDPDDPSTVSDPDHPLPST